MSFAFRNLFAVALLATPISCSTSSSAPFEDEAAQRETTSVLLDIPSRIQWPNDHGYCGETSIQSIALYYGAWISQAVVRDVAGSEVLLGDNETKALDKLNFEFDDWKRKKDEDQFEDFAVWLKGHLADGHPTIFTVYLTDGTNDDDYDHIMPAIGIESRHGKKYDGDDVLTFHNNFGDELRRTFKSLSASRKKCGFDSSEGGCIPKDVDYGTAVTGIVDKRHVTLPTRLVVSSNSEPNVSKHEASVAMRGTVTVSQLTAGKSYALLRYGDADDVPRDQSAKDFLDSKYESRVDFVASGEEWTYTDPKTFRSDGVVFYRTVPR